VRNQQIVQFGFSSHIHLAIQDRAYRQTTELVWCEINTTVDEPIWEDVWSQIPQLLWYHIWELLGSFYA